MRLDPEGGGERAENNCRGDVGTENSVLWRENGEGDGKGHCCNEPLRCWWRNRQNLQPVTRPEHLNAQTSITVTEGFFFVCFKWSGGGGAVVSSNHGK